MEKENKTPGHSPPPRAPFSPTTPHRRAFWGAPTMACPEESTRSPWKQRGARQGPRVLPLPAVCPSTPTPLGEGAATALCMLFFLRCLWTDRLSRWLCPRVTKEARVPCRNLGRKPSGFAGRCWPLAGFNVGFVSVLAGFAIAWPGFPILPHCRCMSPSDVPHPGTGLSVPHASLPGWLEGPRGAAVPVGSL